MGVVIIPLGHSWRDVVIGEFIAIIGRRRPHRRCIINLTSRATRNERVQQPSLRRQRCFSGGETRLRCGGKQTAKHRLHIHVSSRLPPARADAGGGAFSFCSLSCAIEPTNQIPADAGSHRGRLSECGVMIPKSCPILLLVTGDTHAPRSYNVNDTMNGRLTLTKRELAAQLNVSTRTLDRMRAAGELPEPVSGCRHPRWALSVILHWLQHAQPVL
jgi:hypothetical protein